jgi:predicted AlkP superfamily pyrophosphatase or phosphodiesterase
MRPSKSLFSEERSLFFIRYWLCLCLFIFIGGSFSAPIADHVFIISFDGGKPSVMQESRMPNYMAMLAQSAGTWNAQTVLPSVILIAHTSMLTGVGPSKHKIDGNGWTPEKGLVTVPTIFSLAKAKGYTTPVKVYDTAATALWVLDVPIPDDWDGKPVTSAFEQKVTGVGIRVK